MISKSRTLEHRIEDVTQISAKAKRLQTAREAARLQTLAYDEFEQRMLQRWGVDIKAKRLHPPTLIGGEYDKARALSESYKHLVVSKGKVVEQIIKRGKNGQHAFIDQLTFVLNKQSFAALINELELDDLSVVQSVSFWLHEIFGFYVSHDREKSANFYSSSYNIGNHETSYGLVCIGGGVSPSNEETVCIELTATGLSAALPGWEQRLYRFSKMPEIQGFRYTRMDLAVDFLSGEYTVDDALFAYYQGGFTNSVVSPQIRKEGADWDNDTRKGRTLYIGTRGSSRMVRVYEKGKQIGDEESPWVRVELEMRSRDLIIPLDCVTAPGDYMSAQYPELVRLFEQQFAVEVTLSKRIQTKQRIMQSDVEHVVKYLKIQASRAVNLLIGLGKTDSQIISLFTDQTKLPKRFHPGKYFAQLLDIDFISDKFINPVCGYTGDLPWPAHQAAT